MSPIDPQYFCHLDHNFLMEMVLVVAVFAVDAVFIFYSTLLFAGSLDNPERGE